MSLKKGEGGGGVITNKNSRSSLFRSTPFPSPFRIFSCFPSCRLLIIPYSDQTVIRATRNLNRPTHRLVFLDIRSSRRRRRKGRTNRISTPVKSRCFLFVTYQSHSIITRSLRIPRIDPAIRTSTSDVSTIRRNRDSDIKSFTADL